MRALAFTYFVAYAFRGLSYKPIFFFAASGVSTLALIVVSGRSEVLKKHESQVLMVAAMALQGIQGVIVYGRYRFKPSIVPVILHSALMIGLQTNVSIKNPFYQESNAESKQKHSLI